jgi:hypothetical protein
MLSQYSGQPEYSIPMTLVVGGVAVLEARN